MKISKRILSVILALAVLFVSLPMTLVASAAVPNISETEYPIGKVLWSFNAAEVSAVPSGWEASKPSVGAWGDNDTALSYDSTEQAVRFYAGNTDSVLNIPAIEGDSSNFIFEAVVTPSVKASSFGLANNVVKSTSVDTDSDGNYDTESATWFAAYNSTVTEDGYFIRKGSTTITRTKLDGGDNYTRPALDEQHTLKMVVLNGNTYVYVNDTLMVLEDGSAEGFTDSNTTEDISIGMFATNTTVYIHSMKVTAIAEPEETLIWDGTFTADLPTADADSDGEIEITTPEEFAAVAASNGLDADGNRIKYELTGDIYLNDTTVEGWQDNSPNAWLDPVKAADVSETNTFYGIINGNGYVVRGVYVNKVYAEGEITRTAFTDANYVAADVVSSGTEFDLYEDVYAGLFPVIGKGAGIIGIGMEDSYISVRDSSAPIILVKDSSTKDMSLIGSLGLVGVVANSGSNQAIIDQCYINDSVELKGGRVAMIGCGNRTNQFVVSNCYSSATVTVFTGTSGGTGDNKWDNNSGNRFMLVSGGGSNPTVYSCYTYGNVANNGAFQKNIAAGSAYTNVYYTSWANSDYATKITWNDIIGDEAKTLMPNLDWDKFETVSAGRPVLKIFTTHGIGTDGAIWNGAADSEMETDSDGYKLITNASELYYAVTASGNFRLASDIWVNDIEVYTKGAFYIADRAPKNWTDTGSFSGNFDGNGKVVRGLFFNTSDATLTDNSAHATGLIPSLASNSTVKKVGVEQTWFRNHCTGRMGAVVGTLNDASGSVIDTCYAGESVYLYGYTKVGGITGGRHSGSTIRIISNCYSLATIKTDGSIWGGIAGDAWGSTTLIKLNNCYAPVSKLVGNGDSGAAKSENCYTTSLDYDTTAVTAAKMMGADALTNMANLNSSDVYQTTMGYPVLKAFDPNYVEEEEVGEVWNGSIAAEYAGGTGTEIDPYIISKGSQLAKAINEFGLEGSYFKLDRDIYLNNIENFGSASNGWFTAVLNSDVGGQYYAYKNKVVSSAMTDTLGAFNGHIDGNGFHIYGLNYTDNSSHTAGLIPIMAAGSIKNLGVDYVKLISGSYTGEEGTSEGVLIGRVYQKNVGMVYIDRCYIGENVTFTQGAQSGMIGYATANTSTNYVAISNSYVLIPEALLNTNKDAAFIADVWNTYYTIENCWSLARPVNPGSTKARASQFYKDDVSAMGDYIKNVFSAADDLSGDYEVSGDYKLYTTLSDAQMRGTKVFNTMTVNGDDAFLYNIGYPTLKWQGNSIPTEEELLSGLINIATAMPMTEYKADTETFIISGEIVSGKTVTIVLDDANVTTFSIAADGTVTLASGDTTVSKALTLGDTAEYKLAFISGFVLAYVDGEFIGLADFDSTPGKTAVFTGFDLDTDTIMVDLYLQDVTFDAVDITTNILLKDLYGNNNYGGIRFSTAIGDTDVIDNMGYATDYGLLVYAGDEIVDEITADNANKLPFGAQYDCFEFTGLGAKGQELFFSVRPYAEVVINEELTYYYYAPETTVVCPVYEANDLYENEEYAEDIKATYGASDKFITNLTQDIEFALFADYHYKEGMYTSQLSDLKAVVETADTLNGGEGADFILSLGDMSNDMAQSKEITNYLLNGTYSDANGTTTDNHNYSFYNLYGNHELESSNTLEYVNSILTNSEVHWGDGSVGSVAAVTEKYADESVGNNDFEKRRELETGSYYWFEKNGIRIIVINTNFSWNPNHINGEVVGWEHNLTGSYGNPSASTNAGRGFDEGTAALANTKGNHLGDTQLAWLEATLMDAVEQGTPCIVMGHDSVSGKFGQSKASSEVRALYAKANAIRTGTVIASFNGHLHTNRQAVVDGVLYLDINTVRNSWWQSGGTAHYADAQTFSYDTYDADGNYVSSTTKSLNTLGQAKNTWFANDPVHCSVKITQSGTVELSGMTSSWMYDVVPTQAYDYAQPGITSGTWSVGDAAFTAAE